MAILCRTCCSSLSRGVSHAHTHSHSPPPLHSLPLRLLAKLPPDGSQQLRALVRACNPLKTLGELATATRIALPQLRLLAAHLVHWGHARVIRTITLRSMYAVSAAGRPAAFALPPCPTITGC